VKKSTWRHVFVSGKALAAGISGTCGRLKDRWLAPKPLTSIFFKLGAKGDIYYVPQIAATRNGASAHLVEGVAHGVREGSGSRSVNSSRRM